ncbi:FmdE family protein [Pseudodesulfovibrio sp.]|uniref:FmdE family protein n=1 Tax=unclassified Pseudodesulfovibrio TaxID=2661612 RepID=UPI003AFF795E
MKRIQLILATTLVMVVFATSAFSASNALKWTPRMETAASALSDGMAAIGVKADQSGFMVLTNAGYGQADQTSTEAFLGVVTKVTERTPGTHTLLLVNTPCFEPLWFAMVRKDNQQAVFIKLTPDGFAQQKLDLSPAGIFRPEVWAAAAKGLVGSRLFSVSSISLSWVVGAPWPMLKGAELHDHFCPGLNAGFIAKAYLEKHLPLGPGDKYTFVGAPPICAMDALQSAYGATMGKHGSYSMLVPDAAKAVAKDGVAPTLIAMRVNQNKNVCDGLFIGFDWDKSQAFTGVTSADMNPKGGKNNPLFFISRVKMSWKLVQMDMDAKLACIKELGKFSGQASLAKKIAAAGADPYKAALGN